METYKNRHTCQGCGNSWRSAKESCGYCASCGWKDVATAPLPWLPEGVDYTELDFTAAGIIIFNHFGEVENSARWAQTVLAETAANSETIGSRLSPLLAGTHWKDFSGGLHHE